MVNITKKYFLFMLQKHKKNWLILVSILLFLIYIFRTSNFPSKNVTKLKYPVVFNEYSDVIHGFKKCIKKAAETYYNHSTIFFIEFIVCIRKHIPINRNQMENFPNYLNEENKIFLPFKNPKDECKWLTIGIGGAENSEKLFKLKYPHCAIYGVEPSFPGNFSNVGELIPYGVGLSDAETKIVMKINGTYIEKPFTVLSLTTILDKYVNSRFVHYLTIDIEGYEYKILEQLVGNGIFSKNKSGIVFCQIDAELHHPQMETAHSEVKNILNPVEFILHFLQDSSPFIPIFNAPYTHHPHQKVTFINIADPECEAAFGFMSYYKKENINIQK